MAGSLRRTAQAADSSFCALAAFWSVELMSRVCMSKRSAANLRRFARIYPIGRPRASLFQGDLEASSGRATRAAKLWRQALANAVQLNMPADALAALARLRAGGFSLAEAELSAAQSLDALLLNRDSEFRKTAELAAVALGVGAGNAAA